MWAVYAEWLAALEQSGLGHAARHSPWLYTMANVLHVLGAALLVGGIAVFDVTLIRRAGHAAEIGRAAIPLAAFGLVLQIPTGVVLLAPEASALGQNPAFLYKLGFIALGVANVAFFHVRMGNRMRHGPFPPSARLVAIVSLVAWTAALAAGRMIAYL
jgi:hypothetical protein